MVELRARRLRLVLAAPVVLLAVAGLAAALLWPDRLAGIVHALAVLEARLGAAGWLVAALVQVLIALCGILPASLGALSAGMLYGTFEGFLLCAAATLLGAVLAFWLSRTLLRPAIARLVRRRRRLAELDRAVARDGWRLVCLMRVSPVMPFALTSYALGLTSLDLRSYLLGTLASLPALLGYVVLGDLSRAGLASLSGLSAAPSHAALHLVLLVLAIGATGLLTLRLGRIVRQVMRLPELPPELGQAHPDPAA